MNWPLSEKLQAHLEVTYSLERVIGQGGMGCVILATDRTLERRVAIKVLRADAAKEADLRERFRREARLAARLSHPNIVPLHAFGEVDGEMFFVMSYVDGETLETLMERVARLPAPQARRILSALASALDYAHGYGVVHRDIKPQNIMIERGSGRPMLTDFGVARERTADVSLTQSGMIIGTPRYMSPEQVAGDREVDGRSDLYSLGVVGYRMFAGRLPFTATTMQGILAAQMTVEPAAIPEPIAQEDPGLVEIILRALRKNPEERWKSGAVLADALHDAESDEALPELLLGLDSMFARLSWFAAMACMGLELLPYMNMYTRAEANIATLSLAAMTLLAPFLVAFVGWRKHKLSFSRIWLLGWRAPKKWNAWWPRRYRRHGDAWEQFPADVRRARIAGAISAWFLLPLEAAFIVWMVTPSAQDTFFAAFSSGTAWLSQLGLLVAFLTIVAVTIPILRATARLKKLGVSPVELRTLLTGPTADPRWAQERYTRLLELVSAGTKPNAPARLEEITTKAITALVGEIAGAGKPVPADLASAAEAAERARQQLAVEADRLVAEVDLDAIAKLDRRLAELGDDPRNADLRALLSGQRDLLVRMQQRVDELNGRRVRLGEQIKLIHGQLVELRASGADAQAEITGRIREASAELRRASQAWAETEQIAPAR